MENDLSQAIHTLLLAEIQAENISIDKQLKAVAKLRDAPDDEIYQQGLLQALRSPSISVVNAATKACVERFKRLPEDSELIDRVMLKMLDACFLNLTGQTQSKTGQQFEKGATTLIKEITQFLNRHPLQFEHHRSRLLARSRQIQYIEGSGEFSDAVVQFQDQLGKGKRSDSKIANEIYHLRKYHAYSTKNTKNNVLESFLKKDREDISLDKTTELLFQSYNKLLNVQNIRSSEGAIRLAFNNLINWLDEIPMSGESFEPLYEDIIISHPSSLVPWKKRNQQVIHYLQIHQQLLPGNKKSGDIFQLLQKKYDSSNSEAILIKGLQLLQRLPLMRHRSEEICKFILLASRRSRSLDVWTELLLLVEKLTTGLTDFAVNKKDKLETSEKKLNKYLKQVLKHDKRFRDLLYKISFDNSLVLHNKDTTTRKIREQAWRTLLRCLPHERKQLYAEGLQANNRHFFIVTLEEAGNHQQRMLWPLLIKNWHEIVDTEKQSTQQRQKKIYAVCDYFQKIRNYEALQSNKQNLSPIIALALDDHDQGIRQYAEQAIITAGYKLELEKEQQKRKLLALNEELTKSNQQLIEVEQKRYELQSQVGATQIQHTKITLQIQSSQQQQEALVTDGFITTADQQVSSAELRERLEQTLAEARRQLSILNQLEDDISRELRESRRLHDSTNSLVSDQRRYEKQNTNLRRDIHRSKDEISRANNQLSQAKNNQLTTKNRLNSLYPPERSREDYDQAYSKYLREQQQLNSDIARYNSIINTAEQTSNNQNNVIRSYEQQISSNKQKINALQVQINRLNPEINRIENNIGSLRNELSQKRVTWKSLQNQIAQLRSQARQMNSRFQQQNQKIKNQSQGVIKQRQQQQDELGNIQQALQALSQEIKNNNNHIEQQRIHSKKLGQELDSGHQHYEDIGKQAIPIKSQNEHEAYTQQLQLEYDILGEQKKMVAFNKQIQTILDNSEQTHFSQGTQQRSRQKAKT